MMSILSIIESALESVPVTSVTSAVTHEVTEKPLVNQTGYFGYSGYSKKTSNPTASADAPALRRWRVTVQLDEECRSFDMLSPADQDHRAAEQSARFHFGERLVAITEVRR